MISVISEVLLPRFSKLDRAQEYYDRPTLDVNDESHPYTRPVNGIASSEL
jgi:hypothetical protein